MTGKYEYAPGKAIDWPVKVKVKVFLTEWEASVIEARIAECREGEMEGVCAASPLTVRS